MKNRCPSCNKIVEPGSKYKPFCSERCRLIDLGDWISGNHRITDKENPDIPQDIQPPKTRH